MIQMMVQMMVQMMGWKSASVDLPSSKALPSSRISPQPLQGKMSSASIVLSRYSSMVAMV